jgi:hypothetical protein
MLGIARCEVYLMFMMLGKKKVKAIPVTGRGGT